MKKVIVLFLFCLSTIFVYSQATPIQVTKYGSIESTVKVDNFNKELIWAKTVGWVDQTYQNPEKVITGRVEGVRLSINGFSKSAWHFKSKLDYGIEYFYDMEYRVSIVIYDEHVSFSVQIDNFSVNGRMCQFTYHDFFKSSGEYKEGLYNTAKPTLETTLNGLLNSYYLKISSTDMTSNEAVAELKKYKEKLDLELITQEEYNNKKQELSKFIK